METQHTFRRAREAARALNRTASERIDRLLLALADAVEAGTEELLAAVLEHAPAQDIIIQAAAPADFCPAQAAEQKIKKQKGEPLTLTLQQTPDVAAAVGKARRPGQTLVIFAAETQRLEENAREKMARKNADLVVANDVTREGAGFGADTNIVTLLDHRGAVELPKMTKRALADAILTRALQKGESV